MLDYTSVIIFNLSRTTSLLDGYE